MHFRNGSIGLINNEDPTIFNFTWIVPPRGYFVDFQEVVDEDGSKAIIFENGTSIINMPPLPSDATDFERETALIRYVDYGNET